MSNIKSTYWFPAKRYGWGWRPPHCWQGWLVLGVYSGLIVAGIPLLDAAHRPLRYLSFSAALTGVFVMVCWLKGEQPQWRWGRD